MSYNRLTEKKMKIKASININEPKINDVESNQFGHFSKSTLQNRFVCVIIIFIILRDSAVRCNEFISSLLKFKIYSSFSLCCKCLSLYFNLIFSYQLWHLQQSKHRPKIKIFSSIYSDNSKNQNLFFKITF